MIFSKFFHLSREGSKTIMQAGIWLAVFNLAALLPVVLLAMVSESMMTKHFAGDGGNIPLAKCQIQEADPVHTESASLLR